MSLYAQKHDTCPTCTCTDPVPPHVAEAMVPSAMGFPLEGVNRFEVIDHRPGSENPGRAMTVYGAKVEVSMQDGGRTLKVLLS